jgi:type II secretory ATPase GspE/PulE/Tfp pilus assembly ATPase PilB-like protein
VLEEEKLVKGKASLKDIPFHRPKPSKDAADGYKGRVGIYEVLPITETIKELVSQNATTDIIQQQARSEGMVTMVEDGIVKAAQGITSIEEVLRVIME